MELSWLVRLRWIAIAGHLALLLIAELLLPSTLPVGALFLILAAVAGSNALLWVFRNEVKHSYLGYVVLFDVVALSALLALTGGAGNPFSLLYIVHVAVAAVLLGERWTWGVAGLSTLLYGALFIWHREIPELSHHLASNTHQHGGGSHASSAASPFSLHLQGMWVAFALVSIVLASFFSRLVKALGERERALKEAQILQLKYERLAWVTTVAANAAHELNTPLSTIGLAASEMLRVADQNEALRKDTELIQREVSKCAQILERLRLAAGDLEGEAPHEILVEDLVEEIRERLGGRERERLVVEDGSVDSAVRAPRRPLIEALLALVKNALEAAPSESVKISFVRMEDSQQFAVIDRGPGLSAEELRRIGEPFYSTKKNGAGLGLGVYLARAFADRMRGRLEFRSLVGQGTTAELSLPIG